MENNANRYGFWIDAYKGEPVAYDELISDLAQVDVVYLGERHTLKRHHDIQHKIVSEIISKNKNIILGLEQLEAFQQPIIDRYNRQEITFDQLAEQADWASRWSNYLDYREIVETVHNAGGIVVGLNARQEIVRKVARKGLDSLTKQERNELPEKIDTSNSSYRQHMNDTMMVMAHVKNNPAMLDRMFTAQLCRDEMMAKILYEAITSSDKENVVAVVLCGSGHVSYGAGIPSRLRCHSSELNDRIVVLSDSGDVVLSGKMRAMSRDVKITHKQLKCFDTPVADYLHVVNLKGCLEKYPQTN